MTKSTMVSMGSRAQVMNGTAKCTAGRLTKADLMYKVDRKTGARRIISKKNHEKGKKAFKYIKQFVPPKGTFGAVLNKKKKRASSKKKRKSSKVSCKV